MTHTFDFTSRRLLSTEHLRHPSLWLGCGLALVLAVVTLSVIDIPADVQSVMLHDKVVHLCVYAGLMGWFAQIFRNDLARLALALAFVALGIGVEFLQGLVPSRQFELLDMVANTSGVLLAWALSYTRMGEVLPFVERRLARVPTALPRR